MPEEKQKEEQRQPTDLNGVTLCKEHAEKLERGEVNKITDINGVTLNRR